jgi:hypothetical protein
VDSAEWQQARKVAQDRKAEMAETYALLTEAKKKRTDRKVVCEDEKPLMRHIHLLNKVRKCRMFILYPLYSILHDYISLL